MTALPTLDQLPYGTSVGTLADELYPGLEAAAVMCGIQDIWTGEDFDTEWRTL